LITVCLSAATLTAQAQDHVFAAKEMGLPGSRYVVSETARTAATVSVSIPDFEKRSAPESRWMMCVYTNLAMIDHHPYWAVVYPESGSDTVLIGFPAADDPDSLQALGPEFLGPKALKTIMSVDKMKLFCARLGYRFKYLTGM
jgi:hypothetical protein